jgi:hypothetical protein
LYFSLSFTWVLCFIGFWQVFIIFNCHGSLNERKSH